MVETNTAYPAHENGDQLKLHFLTNIICQIDY